MLAAILGLGGWEIVLIAAVLLILFGARRLPELARGLRLGLHEFGKSTQETFGAFDKEAKDAGESLGGIYGKPAGEALTPDNQTAELYDPAAFGNRQNAPNKARTWWRRLWLRVRALFRRDVF